jgi:RimJ/RimL family protein N-acetyltransferase
MLIGSSICLGPVFQEDAPTIFNWRNRKDILHLDGLYRPLSQGGFDEWYGRIGRDASMVVFSIRRQGDLAFLGYLQIVNIQAAHRSAEIGIMIGEPEHRGRGYGQEALKLSAQFCWQELNLQRLSLRVVGDHPAALHTYQKAGFEVEGVLRRANYAAGEFRDITLLALLRPEPP